MHGTNASSLNPSSEAHLLLMALFLLNESKQYMHQDTHSSMAYVLILAECKTWQASESADEEKKHELQYCTVNF